MKILSLSSENIKRLSCIELTLGDKGNLVIVSGNNEQGKSSLLDSIEMTLHGGASIPPKPVRRGQDKATVEMTLGNIGLPELTVKRVITATGGGSLVVTNKDGTRMSSPQSVLDALVGKLSFDPLAFAKMKPAERSETIRQLLGLNFTQQDKDHEALFNQRTEVNRRVKAKQAMLASNPRHQGVPKEEQSTAVILAEQEKATKVNNANDQVRRRVSELKIASQHHANMAKDHKSAIEQTAVEIARLKEKLNRQNEAFDMCVTNAEKELEASKTAQAEADALIDIDTSVFRTLINEAEATNSKIRKNKEIDKIESEFKEASKEADSLTRKLDAIDRFKRDAIAAANFPVPGMGLGYAGEVLIDGLPFEQASTKGQLMASLAMGAALNPKLRVMLVRSGNDLDDKALVVLADWAKDKDYQIWLEKIHGGGKAAIIIEDGHAVEPVIEQTPELIPQ